MSRFVLTGDSHSISYLNAIKKCGRSELVDGGPLGAARTYFDRFFEIADGDFVFTKKNVASHYRNFKKVTGCNSLFDLKGKLLLSVALSGTTFLSDRFWNKAKASVEADKRFISSGALQYWIDSIQENAISFYTVCIESGLLAAALAPPPFQSRAKAIRIHGRDELFRLEALYRKPIVDLLSRKGRSE